MARHSAEEEITLKYGQKLARVDEIVDGMAQRLAALKAQATDDQVAGPPVVARIEALEKRLNGVRSRTREWPGMFRIAAARVRERTGNPRTSHRAERNADAGYTLRDL